MVDIITKIRARDDIPGNIEDALGAAIKEPLPSAELTA